MANVGEQTTLVANVARKLVFFPNNLVYNYGTGQWTRVPAYAGLSYFSINSKTADIGINRFSGNSVQLQSQNSTDGAAQTATLESGSQDFNPGGRAVVTGVRPFVNGGTMTVRVGEQDQLNDAVTYSTSTALTSRTGVADFRLEGRYHRVEIVITGGFTTAQGYEIEYRPQGFV